MNLTKDQYGLDQFDRNTISFWEQENNPDYAVTEQISNTPNPQFGTIVPFVDNPEIQNRFRQIIREIFPPDYVKQYQYLKTITPEDQAQNQIQALILAKKTEKKETAKIVKEKLAGLIHQDGNSAEVQQLLDSKAALASYFQIDAEDLPDDDSYLPDNLEKQRQDEQERITQKWIKSLEESNESYEYYRKDEIDINSGHGSKLTPLDNGNILFTDIDCCNPNYIYKTKQEVTLNPDKHPKLIAQTPRQLSSQFTKSEINAICDYAKKQRWEEPEHIPPEYPPKGKTIKINPKNGISYGEILGIQDEFLKQEQDLKQARLEFQKNNQKIGKKEFSRKIQNPFTQFKGDN